ncbi:MAG: bifunctional DNA-formamidopyrimidine glycosylase/DNA-(apurinic or apyrimidinic site) lyase [Acidobacteria bacterium]|nr:bifunctional DNA-formamidopyrimidine glycosylase/DNA-(apurinic or apyrimidinic site) lyase [Acidobacteriota bacterium]
MPELPEVEMVVRHLRSLLLGRRIVRARLLRPRLAPGLSPRQFGARLRGGKIGRVERRGKHIVIDLDNGWTWVTHLRMSGRFLLSGIEPVEFPFTHATFDLDSGRRLLFTDQRHFGLMMVVRRAELESVDALRRLGPEPFDEAFSVEYLKLKCHQCRQPIKLFLLDQTKVVGLGNIYAAEALHRAAIDPRRTAASLTPSQLERLQAEIRKVLHEAIEVGSTLNTDPQEIYGRYGSGAFEDNWRVYDREGEACLSCAAKVERIAQGGRSTYFCPACQR